MAPSSTDRSVHTSQPDEIAFVPSGPSTDRPGDHDAVDVGPSTPKEVERAKGLLMGLLAVDADGADALLRNWSATHGLTVRDVSAAVVFVAADAQTPHDRSRALGDIVSRLQQPPGAV